MSDYTFGPETESAPGNIIKTFAKKRPDGLFVAGVRLVSFKQPEQDLEIGLVHFRSSDEAHVAAQELAMNYLGASRAIEAWTE